MKKKIAPIEISKYDKSIKYAVVSTFWNKEYIDILEKDCLCFLREHGINNIKQYKVAGSFELPYGALRAIKKGADVVIIIGVVIRGETTHYDHICIGVTKGIIDLQVKYEKPIVFGLLTCENISQVKARLNKGKEWALSAIQISTI